MSNDLKARMEAHIKTVPGCRGVGDYIRTLIKRDLERKSFGKIVLYDPNDKRFTKHAAAEGGFNEDWWFMEHPDTMRSDDDE